MKNGTPDYVVVLAAGKGTRMGSADCPKVCFPVNGVPAIERALSVYHACGIPQHVVVVGTLAEKVMAAVTPKFPNTAYVYQAEQLGTAHALRCALSGLPVMEADADILIAAGDRLIERSVLEQLFNVYAAGNASLAITTTDCTPDSGQGRIVRDSAGNPVVDIERADIRKAAVLKKFRELPEGEYSGKDLFAQMCSIFFGNHAEVKPAKGEKAFGELWTELQTERTWTASELKARIPAAAAEFRIKTGSGEIVLTPEEALNIRYGSTSVYLVKAGILKEALAQLNRNNAQQEEYLTDIIGYVSAKGLPVRMFHVSDKSKLLGFNNPAELLEVERQLSGTGNMVWGEPDPEVFPPLKEWKKRLSDPGYLAGFDVIYGEDQDVVERQLPVYRQVLDTAETVLDENAPTAFFRSPGRLNVLGRHVDHQGGNCNLMTISYETIMLAHPRNDDRVVIRHCQPDRFASCEFSIADLVADLPWSDWKSLVDSPKLAKMIHEYGVDWTSYIKAVILRLQKKFPARPLRGMDLVVGGNIPMAAGLSSSSSLIVGAAEAAVAVNKLDTFPAQFVTLCGEGEWFVGTRGGSADHAAVKMGRQGKVIKVGFFEFSVEDTVTFPDDYVMVVCDSGVKARKSSNAKDQFNHRVSCYRAGFKLIQKFCPQYRSVLHYLRDVNVKNLQVPLAQIYRILLMLPEKATKEELQALLPEENLDALFAPHNLPENGTYPIRGVILYGLAECARSAVFADALKRGDIAYIGELMKISHDGDRVVSFDRNWKPSRYAAPVDNATILNLLSDLESGDPDRVLRAQLIRQPGCYACSVPEIDLMVDIALRTEGVAGAQLAGAGLGGCMMVLARREAVNGLIENLKKGYYAPRSLKENILVCRPIAGAGRL